MRPIGGLHTIVASKRHCRFKVNVPIVQFLGYKHFNLLPISKFGDLTLSIEEGVVAVRMAREEIDKKTKGEGAKETEAPASFAQRSGVFVTIKRYPSKELRGCIGYPEPVLPLKEALVKSAQAATLDPRFPPLDREELTHVTVEVTVLTPPQLISVEKRRDYPTQVEIGRHGLIVERGLYKGLLLPQVAVEQGWDASELLSHTCMKACLMPDSWLLEETAVYRFEGQIFAEESPYGEVREIPIR